MCWFISCEVTCGVTAARPSWANRWSTLTEQRKYKSHARDLFAYKSSCVTVTRWWNDHANWTNTDCVKCEVEHDTYQSTLITVIMLTILHTFTARNLTFWRPAEVDYWGLCWPVNVVVLNYRRCRHRKGRTFTVLGESWAGQLLLCNWNPSREEQWSFPYGMKVRFTCFTFSVILPQVKLDIIQFWIPKLLIGSAFYCGMRVSFLCCYSSATALQ